MGPYNELNASLTGCPELTTRYDPIHNVLLMFSLIEQANHGRLYIVKSNDDDTIWDPAVIAATTPSQCISD